MNPKYRTSVVILILLVSMVFIGVLLSHGQAGPPDEIEFSEVMKRVRAGDVVEITFVGQEITGKFRNERTFKSYGPGPSDYVLKELEQQGIVPNFKQKRESPIWALMTQLLPLIVIFVIIIFFMRQLQMGGGKAMSFGKSRARLQSDTQKKVTFEDVAGVDEAKDELREIIEFLKDPKRFTKLGGRIPKGVLLMGAPGTGKTLLARAIAGEAGVPFFSISGSDFVEMFVGVGASRVRDLFEQGKKYAPCIIFIDEIDAVGRHRGAGLGGGHDEREQTLNQLLVEMDGFEGNEGVIVIAATNRPDVLDPALLRPGRFDRQVVVGLPDVRGREQILKVHMRKVPVADDVKPSIIARGTPGFSGADLANLVNEAALFAARENSKLVHMAHFEKAKDKIMMGAERKSMVMSEDEKKLTAYHEAGHAIVGLSVPSHDPVYKVTIIPRGRALGVTMFLPEADRYSYSKERLESQIASMFGGRIAEELVFGPEHVTTGASNDIQRATEIARNMVTKWGLSEKLGPLTYMEEEGEVFLGHSVAQNKHISDETAHIIDEEIRVIIDRNYQRAEGILKEKRDKLDRMADALIKYETIDQDQIADIMAGKPPRPPADWSDEDSDNGKAAGSSASVDSDSKSANDGTIGNPAGEH